NPSEMDTVEDLRRKLRQAEEQNLKLTNQRNSEMSRYEKEILKLRLELERGEALHQRLEQELSLVRKEVQLQMYSAEEELYDAK
ncbi:CC171 protein, partial [Ptilonorhynchus violaceus]|nr:CC171 protein [Ptilonorhynchus violaceus]